VVKIEEQSKSKEQSNKETKEEEKITISLDKTTIWKGVSVVLGILVVYMFFFGGFSKDSISGAAVQQPTLQQPSPQPRQAPTQIADFKSLEDDDPFIGDDNAPVTIIEFSDFQCPFCRRFYTQTLPQIKSTYIDTGKVKFVYRDFPLSFHPGAQPAAEAGECADEQGKFWELHDKIFDEQGKQGTGTVQFSSTDLKQWAADIGLDTGKFNECLDTGKYRSEVQADFSAGGAAGVTGTPGFIINGKPLTGAQPFTVFQQIIEAELSG